jgi:hypothetical protein
VRRRDRRKPIGTCASSCPPPEEPLLSLLVVGVLVQLRDRVPLPHHLPRLGIEEEEGELARLVARAFGHRGEVELLVLHRDLVDVVGLEHVHHHLEIRRRVEHAHESARGHVLFDGAQGFDSKRRVIKQRDA